jgi:hypothetical protein
LSSLTRDLIGVIARRRTGADASERPRYEALVDDALKALARRIAGRDDFTEGQKELGVTCTAGVITVSDDTLLLDTLAPPRGVLTIGGVIAKPVRNYKALAARRDRSTYWYALQGRKIYVANLTTGALGAASGAGLLTANYNFSLALMPPRYDEELIAVVVELAGQGGSQGG